MPEWYPLIKAARYLGVAPWELAERSAWWMNIAIDAQMAEAGAQNVEKRVRHGD